jgi:quinate dehydrogenase
MSQNTSILQQSYQYGSSMISPSTLTTLQKTYLFGHHLHNSLAPLLHSTLFSSLHIPWTYTVIDSPNKHDFLPLLKSPDCMGSAVTMPHKVSFISELDDITDEARIVGAINTVFLRRKEGRVRYIGTNTDTIGIREAFLRNFPGIAEGKGKTALLIGGGGACRSAVYALWAWLGVEKIFMVNRLREEVDVIIDSFNASGVGVELLYVDSVEQARSLEAPTIVVGTVPDFPPKEPGEILAREIVTTFLEKEEKGYVLEMCYHPNIETEFFRLATRNGWRVLPGTEPMIYQGIAQQMLWLEKGLEEFDVERAKGVIDEALKGSR